MKTMLALFFFINKIFGGSLRRSFFHAFFEEGGDSDGRKKAKAKSDKEAGR